MDLRDGHLSRLCKAYVFDEPFGVNSTFNAELFVTAPHAVTMKFDLFTERGGVVIGLRAAASLKGNFWDSALENCTIAQRRQLPFMYNAPHEKTLSDLIGRDCLTSQGDRVTVELIATDENLPPRFIVTRFVYLRIAIFDSQHP